MGRYYSGDIEGKFWFGVQASDDASFFGGEETEPAEINYYFDKSHLPEIKDGVKTCLEKLGDNKEKLDKFFKDNAGYNDEMIVKQTDIKMEDVNELLMWYARLELGEKILKCVEEEGECSFDAEI